MELAERETLIAINLADKRDGYFWITTTEDSVYRKIISRIPESELKIKPFVNGGRIIQRQIQVPIKYLRESFLPLKPRGDFDPNRIQARAEHARKVFHGKKPLS